MATYSQRWTTAKTKFEDSTGVKKPKPTGVFNKFFNHTSLTAALAECDGNVGIMATAAPKDKPKLLVAAEKSVPKMSTAISTYVKVLEDSANDEKSDAKAKTELYRHLKLLIAELKAIDAHAHTTLSSVKIAMDTTLNAQQIGAKNMQNMLKAALANANLAVKAVQADPTPTTFNKYFDTNDTPGRKVQVQLVAAADQQDTGKIPAVIVDPRNVAEMFTPWQAQLKPKTKLLLTATKEQVTARINEFKEVLKFAQRYSDAL